MSAPGRFLRLELLSVRNRVRLDPDYIKLPPDIDGEGRRPQGLPGLSFQIRRLGGWESSGPVL